VKTLEEFDYTQSPLVSAAKMLELADGGYIDRAEPILFIGECGTGENASAEWSLCGGLPAETACSLYDRRCVGE
jgi:IstB-like ATP binding protein